MVSARVDSAGRPLLAGSFAGSFAGSSVGSFAGSLVGSFAGMQLCEEGEEAVVVGVRCVPMGRVPFDQLPPLYAAVSPLSTRRGEWYLLRLCRTGEQVWARLREMIPTDTYQQRQRLRQAIAIEAARREREVAKGMALEKEAREQAALREREVARRMGGQLKEARPTQVQQQVQPAQPQRLAAPLKANPPPKALRRMRGDQGGGGREVQGGERRKRTRQASPSAAELQRRCEVWAWLD